MQAKKKPIDIQKSLHCKEAVMSELRKSFKKDWNYIKKRLVNVNKGGTFAPATTKNVHRNTDRN